MQRLLKKTAPDQEGAQAPLPEGSEDAWGGLPTPPGTFSGEMVTFDMGSLVLGSRRVHLYEW